MVIGRAVHEQRRLDEVRRRALDAAVEQLSAGGTGRADREDGGFLLRMSGGVSLVGARVTESEGPDWLELTAEASIPTDLLIGAEGIGSRLGKMFTGPDVETGESAFDRAVLLRGSEVRLLAIFDRRTRDLLVGAVSRGCTVAAGKARGAAKGDLTEAASILLPSLEVAEIARTISERAQQPVTGLLRENAMGDPAPGVRRRCLQMLLEQFPGHAETRVALEAASVDPDADVRIFASARMDGGGADALAEIVADEALAERVRVDAMRRLVEGAGSRVLAISERELSSGSTAIRTLAIGVIGRARRSTSIPALLSLATRATERDEQLALAEAFWRLRDPAAEAALLHLLETGEPAVRVQAARALGRAGGVGAVAPLRRLQGLLAGELGRVAEEAIVAIQERLRHASEGQLTVSDTSAGEGRLSVPADRGALSVPKREDRKT